MTKEILHIGLAAIEGRQGHPAQQVQVVAGDIDFDQALRKILAAELRQPAALVVEIARRGQLVNHLLIVQQLESDRGMAERHVLEQRFDVLVFGLLGAQKLLARGDVVKQFQHLDLGALRQRIRHRVTAIRPCMRQAHSARWAREVSTSRDTEAMLGNASPRNPSEAIFSRSSRLLILLVAWRDSALPSSSCDDPAAVIADPNHARPARLDFDRDRPCACIEAVLHQFLDHRSRPFDHFAGRDLVDQV